MRPWRFVKLGHGMEFRRSPVIGLSGMQYNISELGFGIQHIHTIHMVCVFNDPTLYWRLRIVNCVKSDMKASSDLVFNFFTRTMYRLVHSEQLILHRDILECKRNTL